MKEIQLSPLVNEVFTGLEKNEKTYFVEVVKKDTQKTKNALHSR
jgi:hypothetical protein